MSIGGNRVGSEARPETKIWGAEFLFRWETGAREVGGAGVVGVARLRNADKIRGISHTRVVMTERRVATSEGTMAGGKEGGKERC